MIPTSIDGTDITGATIDGTDVQEITVDGDVVFTAAPSLPASAIHQYKFDEGSGNTAFDSIGNRNLTNNGPSYVADSDFVGGFKVDFAGGDADQHFAGASEDPTLQRSNNFSFAVTIVPDAFNNRGNVVFNGYDGGEDQFVITTDSELVAGFVTPSIRRLDQVDQSMSVGERARIVFTWDGSTSTLYKNTNPSTANNSGSDIRSNSTGVNMFRIGFSNNPTHDFNGVMDNAVIYNSALTQAEVQTDFDAQPWTP